MPLLSRPSIRALVGRALLVGIAAGLRSMTPLGVLAAERNESSIKAGWKDWSVLRSNGGRIALQLAWLGELVGDKLPSAQPRIETGPLAGRMVLGSLAGMAIGTAGKGLTPRIASALAGIAGAVAGSYGGYHARTYLTNTVGLPDLPGALIEDATAYCVARKAVRG